MKPVAFDYDRPSDLAGALAAVSGAEGAKLVAGAQSLGPMLNLRLARPSRLIAEITVEKDRMRIGAAVTHARIEDGEVPAGTPAMLRHVACNIAYRAVRNRGTVGGSLAHADPAADWITTMTALAADVEAVKSGRGGKLSRRSIPMEGFMTGAYRTALAPDEMIAAVSVPRWSGAECWGYYKICRKVGEFADAIGAVVIDPDRSFARVVAGATEGAPLVLDELAAEIARTAAPLPAERLREALAARMPHADDVKLHQLTAAVRRAIERIFSA